MIGDGAARIKGTVRDERGADEAKRVIPWSGGSISGEFDEGLVISPIPQSYRVRISCTGSDEVFTSEPTSLSGFPKPIDLGNVQLKRRRA